MTECIDIGSNIVTLAIMMHGVVIEMNLSYDTQHIFDNTRLFSLAGDFSATGWGPNSIKSNNLEYLNSIFQIDLTQSTSRVMDAFTQKVRPKYAEYIKSFFHDLSSENICRVFQTITIDKALGTDNANIFTRMMNCILPDVLGIYVISVHEKTGPNMLKLIYPAASQVKNLNLLNMADFIQFASIFGKEPEFIVNKIRASSTSFPVLEPDAIMQMRDWKITASLQRGEISNIRLSYLVQLIKEIVGADKCKLNIFDYSCSVVSPDVSKKSTTYSRYMDPDDVEKGASKTWGGRTKK